MSHFYLGPGVFSELVTPMPTYADIRAWAMPPRLPLVAVVADEVLRRVVEDSHPIGLPWGVEVRSSSYLPEWALVIRYPDGELEVFDMRGPANAHDGKSESTVRIAPPRREEGRDEG